MPIPNRQPRVFVSPEVARWLCAALQGAEFWHIPAGTQPEQLAEPVPDAPELDMIIASF